MTSNDTESEWSCEWNTRENLKKKTKKEKKGYSLWQNEHRTGGNDTRHVDQVVQTVRKWNIYVCLSLCTSVYAGSSCSTAASGQHLAFNVNITAEIWKRTSCHGPALLDAFICLFLLVRTGNETDSCSDSLARGCFEAATNKGDQIFY